MRVRKYPIQNHPFEFGLYIKNTGNKKFTGCEIKDISIYSAEDKNVKKFIEQEYSIKTLNPDEDIKIWIPKPFSTLLKGLIWIECKLIPSTDGDEIQAYQKDEMTGVIEKVIGKNKWMMTSFIEGKFELEQTRTNHLIILLTIITSVEALFGLSEILITLIELLKKLLLSIEISLQWVVNVLDVLVSILM